MDLILTAFADAELAGMNDATINQYDALLNENDHDLYQWVTGQTAPPARFQSLINHISQALQNN